jgi:hypothetical protein
VSYQPVAREDGVHVLSEKCSTCIFRPGNQMSLQKGRVRGMVDGAVADESCIPCHKTIYEEDVQPAICRGFWDAHRHRVGTLQVAERLDMVVYDKLEEEQDG